MASKRTLIRRLLSAARAAASPEGTASPSLPRRLLPGAGRRCLHQSGGFSAERLAIPVGEGLIERLTAMGGQRTRLDFLAPPPPAKAQPPDRWAEVEEAKGRLRRMGEGSISYERLVDICGGEVRVAKALEGRGDVLVVGNVVFPRPEQVAHLIQSIIPSFLDAQAARIPPADDPQWVELEELEKARASIDARANAGVRRELWGGLVYLLAQTALFMRLTFWELSWDVMEPICFYVTSFYFMAGYGFFLRTSKEPSFEGLFETRLKARRRRLMKAEGFNPLRLLELRRRLGVCTPSTVRKGFCGHHARDLGGLEIGARDCGCHRVSTVGWWID